MIPFMVRHDGMPEGQGRWVLAVDAKHGVLLANDSDGSLYWKALEECKFVGGHNPTLPIPVVPMQPQQGPRIVTPGINGLGKLN